MNILGIDASGKNLGLSLRRQGEQVAQQEQIVEHIELLSAILAQFCENAALRPEAIDRLALIQGPGTYTGLRGSLLMARSLAMFKGVEVTTRLWHEVALYACRAHAEPVLASRAVRQNQYYLAKGRFQDGYIAYQLAPQLVEADKLVEVYRQSPCLLVGDWPEEIEKPNHQKIFSQMSRELAEWTETDFHPVDIERLVPFYVRPAVRPKAESGQAGQS